MISSYPKVYNLGHRAIVGLTEESVVVQEKVDGSQFSFGLMPPAVEGMEDVLKMRSRAIEGGQASPPRDNQDLWRELCDSSGISKTAN